MAVSLPRAGELCGACGSRLSVNREGVVSCTGGCSAPMYGEAVGFTDYGSGPVLACARCGWKGLPTWWRGALLLECPRCEGAAEAVPQPPAGKHWVIRPPRAAARRVARNALCPCGSGVKVKKCHPEWC